MLRTLFCFLAFTVVSSEVTSQEEIEWGELAAVAVKEEYPDYTLMDYTFQGKTTISEEREQYTFKIRIKKNNEPITVHTYVLVHPETKQPIHVFFDEWTR